MNASLAMARASSGEAVMLLVPSCVCAPPAPAIMIPRPSAIALTSVENFIDSPFLYCEPGLLAKSHVQTCEDRELRYARARMRDGVLRFDECVVNGRAAFPCLAGA